MSDESDSGRHSDSHSEDQDSPGGHKPIKVEPFDFGEEKEALYRALELNRQLLYESQDNVLINPEDVQEKIDDLLDRLRESEDE